MPEETARRIFAKINGHYMFPESHSHAFAVTAYQAAWLKRHHPLEFFTALMNNQPMGFYPLETLKQDARRFGVPFRNPCVNRSLVQLYPSEDGAVRLGLQLIKDMGAEAARRMVEEREARGPYAGAGDLVRRTGLKPQAVLSLVHGPEPSILSPPTAGWRCGTPASPSVPPGTASGPSPVSTEDGAPDLADFTAYERMAGEYRVMGVYPQRARHGVHAAHAEFSRVLPTTAVEAGRRGGGGPGRRLARGSPAPQGQGRHGLRHHRGRDGRRAAHPLAPRLRAPPQGAGEPGAPGQRRRVALGTAPPTSSSPKCGP